MKKSATSVLPAAAPSKKATAARARARAVKTRLHYTVAVHSARAHLFAVRLRISKPARRQRLSLPVWIPGSYLVREFSQHLQCLTATQGGQPLDLRQIDKHNWQLANDGTAAVELCYEVYAFDASVRTAFLDATRGFFNATSLCLRVIGQEDQPHAIEVLPGADTDGWQVATGLTPQALDAEGFGHYLATDYDELADCPVEMGRFWSGSFTARGVPHRFVVSGAGEWFDGERLMDDTRRIVETQIDFWHGAAKEAPQHRSYVFMLYASADGYGGLEHRNSTALICQRADLPRLHEPPRSAAARVASPQGGAFSPRGGPATKTVAANGPEHPPLKATDGYTTLLGLISHEYFHTWNVKRLRPAEFKRYDYARENHTELLWFFEGFTSYYDDLFLRRAGLIDDAAYLLLLTKTLNQVLQTPGRSLQSVAEASFDAWVKYYRVGENTPNATVSYYTKGALVALCLDLTLRAEGQTTLDDVMRALWQRCEGGPMREADVAQVLKRLGKRSFATELAEWVHGRSDLPTTERLQGQGVTVHQDAAPLAQQLGLRVAESGGLTVKAVLRGGAGELAGLAAGDEWLGVEFAPAKRGLAPEAWRIQKLDELNMLRGQRTVFTALISRDKRLLRCAFVWPATVKAARLVVGEASRVKGWLDAASDD